jgi:hypothetical protein
MEKSTLQLRASPKKRGVGIPRTGDTERTKPNATTQSNKTNNKLESMEDLPNTHNNPAHTQSGTPPTTRNKPQ